MYHVLLRFSSWKGADGWTRNIMYWSSLIEELSKMLSLCPKSVWMSYLIPWVATHHKSSGYLLTCESCACMANTALQLPINFSTLMISGGWWACIVMVCTSFCFMLSFLTIIIRTARWHLQGPDWWFCQPAAVLWQWYLSPSVVCLNARKHMRVKVLVGKAQWF